MRQVVQSGTPTEMGLQHGAAFADLIPLAVKRFALERGWNPAHRTRVLRQVERNLERVFPESLEELHGIASAANVNFDDLLAYNACQEIGRAPEECTNVALADTPHGTIHFKSNDVGADMKQYHVLQETHPDKGHAFIGVNYVGATWLNAGVNEAGLTYGGSSIPNNDSDWDGIPSNTLLRYLLQYSDTVDAAADMVARTPIMNHGLNLMFTDPSGAAIVVERSPTRTAVRRMDSHTIWNTNHYLTDEMQDVLKQDGGEAAQNSPRPLYGARATDGGAAPLAGAAHADCAHPCRARGHLSARPPGAQHHGLYHDCTGTQPAGERGLPVRE